MKVRELVAAVRGFGDELIVNRGKPATGVSEDWEGFGEGELDLRQFGDGGAPACSTEVVEGCQRGSRVTGDGLEESAFVLERVEAEAKFEGFASERLIIDLQTPGQFFAERPRFESPDSEPCFSGGEVLLAEPMSGEAAWGDQPGFGPMEDSIGLLAEPWIDDGLASVFGVLVEMDFHRFLLGRKGR
jgi:hypothetical protein